MQRRGGGGMDTFVVELPELGRRPRVRVQPPRHRRSLVHRGTHDGVPEAKLDRLGPVRNRSRASS